RPSSSASCRTRCSTSPPTWPAPCPACTSKPRLSWSQHLTRARGEGSLRETAFDIIESKSSARGGEVEEHSLSQRLFAETLGTAILVLVGPGSVVATLVLAGDKTPAIDGSDLLGISFAFGLVITALV